MTKASVKQAEAEATRHAAETWLADRAYEYLLGTDGPVRIGEILRGIAIEGLSLRLVKCVLSPDRSGRFEQVDRKWALSQRYQDATRPTERVINAVLTSCGRSMTVQEVERELEIVYGRPPGSMEQTAARMLSNRDGFFEAEPGRFGLASWLVIPTSDSEEDVLFDNFLDESDVAPYRSVAEKAFSRGDVVKGAEALMKAAGAPVPVKCILFFAWKANPDAFNPAADYAALLRDENWILLSDQRLTLAANAPKYLNLLAKMAETLEEVEEEAEGAEEHGKIELTDADKEEAVKLILEAKGIARAEDIIESVLEVSPGERAFEPALELLTGALKDDRRVAWLGWGQWAPSSEAPDYVYEVPPSLIIPPVRPFETFEGEVHDQVLSDEGLAGVLKKEIFNPLAMDVTDDDSPDLDHGPVPERQRCVLTYHHKAAGTFPLCQIHPDFFPREPDILRIMLTDEGVRREAWVSRKTHLIYGTSDWYQEMPVSGAVFYLEATQKDGEFRFVYDGETDPLVHIPEGRLLELIEINDDPETPDMSAFELITRIMSGRGGSAEFITLLTEVNLIRRVPRRLVASILSSYHCCRQRAKTTVWLFDEKKVSQGFEKNKRKYVVKDQE